VCLYFCFSYLVLKSHLFCAAVYCHLWPGLLYTLPHKLEDFRKKKKLLNKTYVLIFSTVFVRKISLSKKNSRSHYHKYTQFSCKVPIILVGFEGH